MSDGDESKSMHATESPKVAADEDATFFKHDGIETFAELKERLKVKTAEATGDDGR